MTSLRNIAAIFGKEWRQYFASPIAWVALTMWTLLFGVGLIFYVIWYAAAKDQTVYLDATKIR